MIGNDVEFVWILYEYVTISDHEFGLDGSDEWMDGWMDGALVNVLNDVGW